MPKGKLTPHAKKKAIDDAMNWLRNNDPNPADVDDPTAQGLANLTGLPMPGRNLSRRRSGLRIQLVAPATSSSQDVNEPTLQL
jgi:hypothetical protein